MIVWRDTACQTVVGIRRVERRARMHLVPPLGRLHLARRRTRIAREYPQESRVRKASLPTSSRGGRISSELLGLVYIPARDLQAWYGNDPNFSRLNPGEWNLGMDIDAVIDRTIEEPPEPGGMLIAWDPVAQREIWRATHADFWNGGALSTAGGLVFAGTGAGLFSAYDARTGEVKWSTRSQTGIMAGPVSYELDGEQYVSVAAGWGGSPIASGRVEGAIINEYHNEGRVLTFKLGGKLPMPENTKRDTTLPTPAPVTATAEQLKQGASLYNRYCMACHGFAAASSWIVPDLRYLAPEKHLIFADIVVRGALSGNGMPSFDGYLSEEQAELVHQYINEQAQALYDEESQPSG